MVSSVREALMRMEPHSPASPAALLSLNQPSEPFPSSARVVMAIARYPIRSWSLTTLVCGRMSAGAGAGAAGADVQFMASVVEMLSCGIGAAAAHLSKAAQATEQLDDVVDAQADAPQLDLHLTAGDTAFDFTAYLQSDCATVRALSGLTEDEYAASFRDAPGRSNLLSGGRSGSLVCRTHDARLVFKTMKMEELTLLLGLFDGYIEHLRTFPYSMLSRYLGLYRIKRGTQTLLLMVMGNSLNKGVPIHETYDLKGSSVGRQSFARSNTMSGSGGGVGKDLDLKRRIRMDPASYALVQAQIMADVGFLHEHQLMDYSMLLGIHVCDATCAHNEAEFEHTAKSIHTRGAYGFGNGSERFIYVFGIIDLLQSWNLNKKVEQFLKTKVGGFATDGVSAVEPDKYAARFKEALTALLR
eukprot:m.133061 g.133061  ORF g.133061 m.133061 type:complete len:414 (-) comp14820_c0_seq2:28-1269(-)